MAKVIENTKGFLLIEATRTELFKIGGMGICDYCNATSENGVIIAVLNEWFCMDCYNDWLKRAKRYSEDIPIEERNFEYYKRVFNV